jgi:hypothetical protein
LCGAGGNPWLTINPCVGGNSVDAATVWPAGHVGDSVVVWFGGNIADQAAVWPEYVREIAWSWLGG